MKKMKKIEATLLCLAAAYLEALFIYVLINGMVKPIRCIDKHKYSIADCVVADSVEIRELTRTTPLPVQGISRL